MTALRHGSRNAGWHAPARGRAGRAAPAMAPASLGHDAAPSRMGPRPRRARAQPRRCSGRGQQANPATCGRLWPAWPRERPRTRPDLERGRRLSGAVTGAHGASPPTGAAPVPTGADATGCRRALPASASALARVTAAMRALLGLLARARALLASRRRGGRGAAPRGARWPGGRRARGGSPACCWRANRGPARTALPPGGGGGYCSWTVGVSKP
jgi:hypothetical protein